MLKTAEHTKAPHHRRQLPAWLYAVLLLALAPWAWAWADTPQVLWVTPPAWMQTEQSSEPVRAGMDVPAGSWIVTGRAAQVGVRLRSGQARLGESAIWYWSGKPEDETGNAQQGKVSIGPPRGPEAGSLQLYSDGPWTAYFAPTATEADARRQINFLRNAGYPLRLRQRPMSDGSQGWWLGLDGFKQIAQARKAAQQLARSALGSSQVEVEGVPPADALPPLKPLALPPAPAVTKPAAATKASHAHKKAHKKHKSKHHSQTKTHPLATAASAPG